MLTTSLFIPIIIFIIGIFVSKAVTEKKKSIALEIETNKKLFTVEKRIAERLKEIDIEKFLEELNIITFKMVNDGKVGINGANDIVKYVEIIFPKDYQIIGKPTIVDNPYEVEIEFNELCDKNEIEFLFDLLNKNQYFTMDVFYTGGPSVNPILKAKILDLDKSEVRNIVPQSEEKAKKIREFIVYTMIFWVFPFYFLTIIGYLIITPAYGIRGKKLEKFMKITSLITLISSIILANIYYFMLLKTLNISINFFFLMPPIIILISIPYLGLFLVRINKLTLKKYSKRE